MNLFSEDQIDYAEIMIVGNAAREEARQEWLAEWLRIETMTKSFGMTAQEMHASCDFDIEKCRAAGLKLLDEIDCTENMHHMLDQLRIAQEALKAAASLAMIIKTDVCQHAAMQINTAMAEEERGA